MSKLVWLFVAVESIVVLGFLLFGLNILWSVVEGGGGVLGLGLFLGTSLTFRAVSSIFRGYIVDAFPKKAVIIVSLVSCGVLSFAWLGAERLWVIGVLAYIAVIVVQDVYSNSYAALVAEKLSPSDYVKYDSIGIMASRVISVAGNLVSAVLIIVLPGVSIIVAVACVFALGAVACYKFLPAVDVKTGSEDFKPAAAWAFAKENVFGDKKILVFIGIVFLLNIDYAFIPTMLPLYIIAATELASPLLFGVIRAANNIGEFLGSGVVLRLSRWVSRLTKIGLSGSALSFVLLPLVYTTPVAVVVIFAVYSFFDTLTQPFYSYFVSSLASEKRGRILGIVDCVILLASPLGIIIGSLLSMHGIYAISIGTTAVFLISLLVLVRSKIYNTVVLQDHAANFL